MSRSITASRCLPGRRLRETMARLRGCNSRSGSTGQAESDIATRMLKALALAVVLGGPGAIALGVPGNVVDASEAGGAPGTVDVPSAAGALPAASAPNAGDTPESKPATKAEKPAPETNESAPEPSGYWTGPVNSPVPATLTGGTVISSAHRLRELLDQKDAVLIDVSNAPKRPDNLAPGAPWLPLPHRAIPGSAWIPGVGAGEIPAALDDFFRQKLATTTGNSPFR